MAELTVEIINKKKEKVFNICLNDVFFLLKDVGMCNFVDDTTTYIFDESLENVLKLCTCYTLV